MKRYFLVHEMDMPALGEVTLGSWHAIDLGSHGDAGKDHHIVALENGLAEPPATWRKMPSLLDAKNALKHRLGGHHTKLADLGLTGDETMLEAAEHFETIHPLMAH